MNKLVILCMILACVFAHKHLKGNSKQHSKAQGVSFHSATFEMINLGNEDYKLDPNVAKNWDEETKNMNSHHHKEAHIKPSNKKHSKRNQSKFVQLQSTTSIDIVDLSQNTGVIKIKVTDIDGNIVQDNINQQNDNQQKDITTPMMDPMNYEKNDYQTQETALRSDDSQNLHQKK